MTSALLRQAGPTWLARTTWSAILLALLGVATVHPAPAQGQPYQLLFEEVTASSARTVRPDAGGRIVEELHTHARKEPVYQATPVLLNEKPSWPPPSWLIPLIVAILSLSLIAFVVRHRPEFQNMVVRLQAERRRRVTWVLSGSVAVGLLLGLLAIFSPDMLTLRFNGNIDGRLSLLLGKSGVTQLDPGPVPDPALVTLGEALFYDKLLSGNRDISCATCHHPQFATGDGLPLSIGTGGHGLGPERVMGKGRNFIPRNATELFNRGSAEWTTMFWDGRIILNDAYGLSTPAGNGLPALLDSALAAQAMFPVTSRDEMRGTSGDMDAGRQLNEIATVSDMRPKQIWSGLMARIMAEPNYAPLFASAYPTIPPENLGFEHAAAALAAYEIAAFTFMDSPWDRYLAGDQTALTDEAKQGALLFYGDAQCATCHTGNLLTDQQYHNIGAPQLGPGKWSDAALDLGRFLETERPEDLYAFRTPPLRNVTLTGPYLHNGAYADLESVVRQHLDPAGALQAYDPETLPPLFRGQVRQEPVVHGGILSALDPRLMDPPQLTDDQIAQLLAFLKALESPSAVNLNHLVPDSVPSGLPVID